MSEQEKFLERWSRRKQKAAKLARETAAGESEPTQTENQGIETETGKSAFPVEPARKATEAFDVSSLPSIDSIVATTDIRPFLAPGVPAEITRAALHKAWRSDPSIRDFVGLSENSWDFNDPNSMHGFGPLELTDEMKQVVKRMLGSTFTSDSDQTEKAHKPEELSEVSGSKSSTATQNTIEQEREATRVLETKSGNEKNIPSPKNISTSQRASNDDVATQREIGSQDKNELKSKGRHGSALPRKRPTAGT